MSGQTISFEEALAMLDGRCGGAAVATLEALTDEGASTVMTCAGELAHWHNTHSAWAWSGEPRHEVHGVYSVGGATVDVSHLRPDAVLDHDHEYDGLTFGAGHHLSLTIAWKATVRPAPSEHGSKKE
jgi:hypothetical protein